jgi:hypothetical protein
MAVTIIREENVEFVSAAGKETKQENKQNWQERGHQVVEWHNRTKW